MPKNLILILAVLAVLGGAIWYVGMPHDRAVDLELFEACRSGNVETINRALEKGANLNAQRAASLLDRWQGGDLPLETGFTPLMYAIDRQHLDIARLLIEKGADVNQRNAIGNTALIMASTHVNFELVEQLLARGADVTVRNRYGSTAIDFATKRSLTDVHRRLIARLKKAGDTSVSSISNNSVQIHRKSK